MDILQKNKILVWCVVILAVINLVSVGTFWLGLMRPPMPPPGEGRGPGRPQMPPEEFLARELDLNQQQTELFKKEQDLHFTLTRGIVDSVHALKRAAFSQLTAGGNIDKAVMLFSKAEHLMGTIDSITFAHFFKLRGYCNASQLGKFDRFLNDMFISMPSPKIGPGDKPGIDQDPGSKPLHGNEPWPDNKRMPPEKPRY